MLAEDPRASLVGQPFAGLVYDPTLALQQLAEAGWRRGADGRMLNVAGELARLDLRGTVAADSQITAIAQFWRDLGIDVAEEIMPGSLSSERSYRATFPGLEFTAQGASDTVLVRFDGRQCPRPPRFSGSQGGCYMNPELDRLIDRLYGTIDTREQGLALRDIGQIFATDLPALPMYMNVSLAAVRKGIHVLTTDYAGGQGPGTASRNAHLWDRE
jgi:peptide/nickel transport system substrate-binding protein